MIEQTQIDDGTFIARGKFSTYNSAHKDATKRLSVLCGKLSATSFKVLSQMQPDSDVVPGPVDALIAECHATLDEMDMCAQRIVSLAQQKQDVKPLAWGRRP